MTRGILPSLFVLLLFFFLGVAGAVIAPGDPECNYQVGDINRDGKINTTESVRYDFCRTNPSLSVCVGAAYSTTQATYVVNADYLRYSHPTGTYQCNDTGSYPLKWISVSVDTVPPTITISSPSVNGQWFNSMISISNSESDSYLDSCWYSINGGANTIFICNAPISTSWSSGTNTIIIYANDSYGNVGSATRQFYIDIVFPRVTITYPLNVNYTVAPNVINYTLVEINPRNCWYSLDSGGTNTTITCGNNVTGLNPGQGTSTWAVYINDSAGNRNSSKISFYLDSGKPNIQFVIPTEANNSIIGRNNILVNVTALDSVSGLKNITIIVYNSTGLVNTSYRLISPLSLNITGLNDGIYRFNATAYDNLGNANSTETRIVNVDATNPLISYSGGTAVNYANLSQNWIFVNVSIIEQNPASIIYTLFNSSGIFNSTSLTMANQNSNVSLTWINLNDGAYSYNVSVVDLVNRRNSTSTRIITLDITAPNASLIGPDNSDIVIDASNNFTVNITDRSGIKNVTLTVFNTTGIVAQITTVLNGVTNAIVGTVVNLADGIYNWFYTVYDWAGNLFTTENRVLTVVTPGSSGLNAVRSFSSSTYTPGVYLTMNISVNSSYYGFTINECLPAGWSANTITDSGVYYSSGCPIDLTFPFVTWPSFSVGTSKTIGYKATAQAGTLGTQVFNGTMSYGFEGMLYIRGSSSVVHS